MMIANRLVAEQFTRINSNFSQPANNFNRITQSNTTKKKPIPHRGRKKRSNKLINKLNKTD